VFSALCKKDVNVMSNRKCEAYDAENGEIKVLSGVVNGKRGDPKTKAWKASAPPIPSVRELLDLYRLRLGNPTTGVMFKTDANTPIDLKNLFARRIDPVLKACEECGKVAEKHGDEEYEFCPRTDLVKWHRRHAFRRGLASNLNELHVPDLIIQWILRHSNVANTRKAYVKIREDGVAAGMAQMEAEIRRAAERSN
jgi:hypothetical protein